MEKKVTEKEIRAYLNKELVDKCIREKGKLTNVLGFQNGKNGYGFKYFNKYKKSFSIKYDWVNANNVDEIINYVKNDRYGDIIKCSVSCNACHGFLGVVFNVKYADLAAES